MNITAKESEAILSAIRVLRGRRVRPSSQKIAWYVRRESLLDPEDTASVLKELVKNGTIHEVEYKGAISYRLSESAKNSKFDGPPLRHAVLTVLSGSKNSGLSDGQISEYLSAKGFIHSPDRIGAILQRELRTGSITKSTSNENGRFTTTYAIGRTNSKDLAKTDIHPNRSTPASGSDSDSDKGCVAAEIASAVGSDASIRNGQTPFEQLRHHLKLLKRDPNQKKILLSSNGDSSKSLMGDHKNGSNVQNSCKEVEYQRLLEEPVDRAGAMITRRGRPRKAPAMYEDLSFFGKKARLPSQRMKVGKLDRARKVFDPSENSARKRIPPSGEGFQPVIVHCDVCFQSSPTGELLRCHSCSARAHPSCLGYNAELAVKSKMGPWTCMDCKLCAICQMDHNIGTLIFCDKCDRAYHLTCHHLPLDEQPHGSWICFACLPNAAQVCDYLPGLLTPSSSPTMDDESRGGSSNSSWENQNFDPRVPNATHWSVDEVVQYFKEKGFEKYSHAFRDQDIDGTALLMLTRLDVLTGLNMKLGPALKIYKQVRILQTRLTNPPLP